MLIYVFIILTFLLGIAFVIMIFHLFYSMIFSGENILTAIFRSKNLTTDSWELGHSTFVTVGGNINLTINENDLKSIKKNKLKFELTAIFGRVQITLPRDTSFISENRGFFGSIKTTNGSEKGLYYEESYNDDKNKKNPVGFLFNTKTIFGVINIFKKD